VIQRNAPGAISAIAFTVTPVKPNVACILGASADTAISSPWCALVLQKARSFGLPYRKKNAAKIAEWLRILLWL
jgi:hypothetical protein